jgi:hypothetical protein
MAASVHACFLADACDPAAMLCGYALQICTIELQITHGEHVSYSALAVLLPGRGGDRCSLL